MGLKEDLARYGATVGILYPEARAAMFARAKLIDLMEAYRAEKRFADADALRAILRDWPMPLMPQVTRGIFTEAQQAVNDSLGAQALKEARRQGKKEVQ